MLVTDGQHNGAGDPVAVAAAARAQGTDDLRRRRRHLTSTTRSCSPSRATRPSVFTVSAFSQLSSLLNALLVEHLSRLRHGDANRHATRDIHARLLVQRRRRPRCPHADPNARRPTSLRSTPTPPNPPRACLPDPPTCHALTVTTQTSPPVAGCPTFTPTATPTPPCNTSPPDAGCIDSDGDFWPDNGDNCPGIANNDQNNTDAANTNANRPGADALGDACDDDIDGDGYTNTQETALITGPEDPDPLLHHHARRPRRRSAPSRFST